MNSTLVIIMSIIVIVTCAFINIKRKEGLTTKDNIILMGDSILNNSDYVEQNQSVYDILKTYTNNVYNYAKNESTIHDLYLQLDKIPTNMNNSNTYIFISAGGNDILNKNKYLNKQDIIQLFNTYLAFLDALRVKLGNAKINILNLYIPSDPKFLSYKNSIEEWNLLINQHSNTVGKMYNVINLYSLLTTPEDFVYNIEPSAIASKKIANKIYFETL
jgi:hypothetical protein